MTRRDLAFVHLHRPIKAAYLKAMSVPRWSIIRKSGYRFSSTSDISRIYFRTGINPGDHSNPDLPPRLGRIYRVPQDSRDEALDRAARNRSNADHPRDAAKAVTADIWTRRFVERNPNMHNNAFTPENAAMPLIDHQVGTIAGTHSLR
jgi:hypothetical protein